MTHGSVKPNGLLSPAEQLLVNASDIDDCQITGFSTNIWMHIITT